MGNSPSSWNRDFTEVKSVHDEAYRTIEEAITLEEQERPHEAIEKYKQGISLIDRALNVQITFPENPDDNWQKACLMIQKMKKTRAEVLSRINSIQSSSDFTPLPTPPPPSYDEAMGIETSECPKTYSELGTALETLKIDTISGQTEVIYSTAGVKVYHISPSGEVSSTLEDQTLTIGFIEGEQSEEHRIFLQIGDWIYPLVAGVSPCFRTEYGAFILPDLYSNTEGTSLGFIVPEEAYETVCDLLENILHGVVAQKPLSEAATGVSEKIAKGLTTGAFYISQGFIKGAEKTGELLNTNTPKLINSINPAPAPKPVPRKLKKGLKVVENATSTAANVTGFVADKVGLATMKLGHFLAPHIKKQGTKLLTSGFNLSEKEAASKVDGVLTVAAGAVEGLSTIYRGLESSASILGKSIKENSVKVVQHKYGAPTGEVANDGLNTIGNVIMIRQNARILTPKGLVKTTAKQTGKAIVGVNSVQPNINQNGQMLDSNLSETNQPSTSSALYPTLPSADSPPKNSSTETEKK